MSFAWAVFFLSSVTTHQAAWGQQTPSTTPAATTSAAPMPQIGALPDFKQGAKAGVYVTREHADKYRAMLPQGLAELLDQGLFAFEAARAPRQVIEAPAAWSKGESQGQLGEGGTLDAPPETPKGFLFADLAGANGQEPEVVGSKVLWNTTIHSWMWRSWSMGLDFTFIREPKGSARRVQVVLDRLYPRSLGVSPGKLLPLFREKISMRSPAALEGMSWLTLRFFGDEDYLWAASPLTGNARQMTGSNRSDSLFTGAFSPDDLMVWSGKVELTRVTSARLVQLLVPVLDAPWGEVKTSEGCASLAINPPGAVRVNADTDRFSGLPGWVPTNILFVPRPVWRLDLVTTDPFSLDARQTIYVDAATMMPVYRTVWDEGGRLRRFTTGILGTVMIDGAVIPMWRGQLMASPAEATRSTLVPNQLSVCSILTQNRDLLAFDPGTLAPPKSEVARPVQSSKSVVGIVKPATTPEAPILEEPVDDPDAAHGE